MDRFDTSKGLIYLKTTAAPFFNEPNLLEFLHEHVSGNTPTVIAANSELSCFLMQDAGTPLLNSLKSKFDMELCSQALKTYAKIQLNCRNHINALIALGVNDWRFEKLPALYHDFVSQDDLLKTNGLSPTEIESLKTLAPRLKSLCQELSAFGIPETLEHGDFHDNNILMCHSTNL